MCWEQLIQVCPSPQERRSRAGEMVLQVLACFLTCSKQHLATTPEQGLLALTPMERDCRGHAHAYVHPDQNRHTVVCLPSLKRPRPLCQTAGVLSSIMSLPPPSGVSDKRLRKPRHRPWLKTALSRCSAGCEVARGQGKLRPANKDIQELLCSSTKLRLEHLCEMRMAPASTRAWESVARGQRIQLRGGQSQLKPPQATA